MRALLLYMALWATLPAQAQPGDVTRIELRERKGRSELLVDELVHIDAVAVLADGRKQRVLGDGKWSSSAPEVIDGDHRQFLTLKPGEATITVRYGGKTATLQLTIKARAKPTLEIEDPGPIAVGKTVVLSAVFSEPGKKPRKTKLGRWSSGNKQLLSPGLGSEFLAMGAGRVEVTLVFRGVTAKRTLVLGAPPAPALELDRAEAEVALWGRLVLKLSRAGKDVSAEAQWSVAPPLLAIDPKTPGGFEARKEGVAVITARIGQATASCRVTVKRQPAPPLALDRAEAGLEVGQVLRLKASQGEQPAAVTWTVEGDALAADPEAPGAFRAVKPGVAVAIATLGKQQARCRVTVVAPPPLALSQARAELEVGQTLTLSATRGGKPAADVRWSLSGAALAADPEASGSFRAIKPGQATVTATRGEQQASCVVTVKAAPPLQLSQTQASLTVGEGLRLVLKRGGEDVGAQASWKLVGTALMTAPGGPGRFKARSAGRATVQVTLGERRLECKVTVRAADKLALDREALQLTRGERGQLSARLGDQDVSARATWTVEGAAVSVAGGKLEALAAGEAVVSAALDGQRASCRVTVREPAPPALELSAATLSLRAGARAQLSVAGGGTLRWRSAEPLVAAVDGAGVVLALHPGEARITVSRGGVEASCVVRVSAVLPPSPAGGASLTPPVRWVAVGEVTRLQLHVGGRDRSGIALWRVGSRRALRARGDGRFFALRPGVTRVTGEHEGAEASALVIALPAAQLARLRGAPPSLTLPAKAAPGAGLAATLRWGPLTVPPRWATWSADPAAALERAADGSPRLATAAAGRVRLQAAVGDREATAVVEVDGGAD